MVYCWDCMIARSAQSGFSLVELSIVLVILGLLTGGILGGQALIRAAELRAVPTEHARWVTATQTFRDKYFALPGDMTNATAFWGTADAANCALTTTGDARTCNGNGNGTLDRSSSGNPGNEWFRFWQHVANAGLIEGNYAGIRFFSSGDGAESQQSDNANRGYNTPTSRMGQSTWAVADAPYVSGDANYFSVAPGLISIVFGENLLAAPPRGRALRAEEAWNIDTKMDDGMPTTGKVIGIFLNSCTNAATRATLTNVQYNFATSGTPCGLIFDLGS